MFFIVVVLKFNIARIDQRLLENCVQPSDMSMRACESPMLPSLPYLFVLSVAICAMTFFLTLLKEIFLQYIYTGWHGIRDQVLKILIRVFFLLLTIEDNKETDLLSFY